jgi:hypothetical protein
VRPANLVVLYPVSDTMQPILLFAILPMRLADPAVFILPRSLADHVLFSVLPMRLADPVVYYPCTEISRICCPLSPLRLTDTIVLYPTLRLTDTVVLYPPLRLTNQVVLYPLA